MFEDTYRGNELKARIMSEMAKGLAHKIDKERYDQLETATAGNTITITAGNAGKPTLQNLADLQAAMEEDKYEPDVLIVSPSMLAYMMTAKDSNGTYEFPILRVSDYGSKAAIFKGEIGEILGLKVIKTSRANSRSVSADSDVQMVVIDSSRALGEVLGRPIHTVVDDISKAETDKIKIIYWMRIGIDELDPTAIGHVLNPAT